MKLLTASFFAAFVLAISLTVVALAQNQPKPTNASSYLESWQGQPGKPDQTDHAPIGVGTTMACIDVQPRQTGSECVLKYENGGTETLNFRDSITATKTDVVYLTCNATVPRKSCKVQVTSPKQSPKP